MLRKQITLKITESVDTIAEGIADGYNLSKGKLVEMLLILDIINSKCNLTDGQVNEFIDSLILNKESRNRKEFRDLHKTMPKEVKIEILKFLYHVNMIEGIKISTNKQANFWKDDQFIFYYAINNLKEIDINVYIKDLRINVKTIGPKRESSNEYIFIGREQWFNNNINTSSKFDEICLALKLKKPCDCLKIHYTNLYKLIPVIKSI